VNWLGSDDPSPIEDGQNSKGRIMTLKNAMRALVLSAIAVLALQGVAAADDYPPTTGPTHGALSASVSNDGTVSVSGAGCGSTQDVEVTFDGASVATVTPDSAGTFSTSFDIPDGATAGGHDVEAQNDTCDLTTTVTVSDADAGGGGGSGGSLPFTGSSTSTMLLLAAAAMTIGSVIVLATRKRRAQAS
jgi:LPXTG-motif cell wall-anchored protein